MTYLLLDPLKFAVRYALHGGAWALVVDQRVSETEVPVGYVLNFSKPKPINFDLEKAQAHG